MSSVDPPRSDRPDASSTNELLASSILRADGAAKDRRIAQLVRQRDADTKVLHAILLLTYDDDMPDGLADRIRAHVAGRSGVGGDA